MGTNLEILGAHLAKGEVYLILRIAPICDQGKETIKVLFISVYNLARLNNLNGYQTVQLINQII
jgi:hypothetical protein